MSLVEHPQRPKRTLRARAEASPHYRWWVLWVVLAGLFGTNVLFTVFVVAIPQVALGLHTSQATVTWVVTGPMLAFGLAAPAVGRASDRIGHRRMYLIGMALELVTALASATATNAAVLIAARTASGLLGASIGASSMALVLSVFGAQERVKAMGWWSLVGAGGPVIGVALGGPLIEAFGWRALFFMQLPLLSVALVLAAFILPERAAGRDNLPGGFDWRGVGTVSISAVALLLALNRAPGWGWADPKVLALFLVAFGAGFGFVLAERRAERVGAQPVFPLVYLRRRNFGAAICAQTFSNFAYLGAFFLAPLLLEKVYGYKEVVVGYLVLPRPIVFSLLAPVAGYVAVRVGERMTALVGTGAVVASMGVFASAGRIDGMVAVEVALVLSGVGLGFASPPLAASVANEFAAADLGTASAAQQLMAQVGTVAGIQVMTSVQATAAGAHPSAGTLLGSFHAAYLVGGAIGLAAVVGAALLRDTPRPAPNLGESARSGREALEALAAATEPARS